MRALKYSFVALMVLAFAGRLTAVNQYNWKEELKAHEKIEHLEEILPLIGLEEFMDLSPRDIERYTGKKLGLIDRFRLWSAKRFIRKNLKDQSILSSTYRGSMPQIGYIILALLGFGWLAIGVLDNWSGQFWIISLILYLLFYIPGLIYTLIIMGNYY